LDILHTVYLGLGSNLGDRKAYLDTACREIEKRVGAIVRQSSYYETKPWGFDSVNAFVNAVVKVETTLTPRQLLRATQQIERLTGKRREHATERGAVTVYHDRPIDIDILLYDDITIDEPDLKIPHPLMRQRPFVMQPLDEVMNT
jgi:2-amino-4-hydroxy-6-hydroxymethyldihydropteridine diphosphokinase